MTYVAASGDSGAWYGPMYPSVSPNVLAVGGTSLTVSGSNYVSETGWSGSTGGFSGLDSYWQFYEPQPSYQNAALQAVGLSYGVRTTPDVSFNANPSSGVSVYDSVAYSGQSGWFQVGGTSAAAPAWAGLIAIADQGLATAGKPVLSGTQAQSSLYSLPSSDFHDITSGFNGYSATPGYDLVTGLGSPKANLVIAGILSANGVTQTAAPAQIVSASSTTTTTSSSSTHRFRSHGLIDQCDRGRHQCRDEHGDNQQPRQCQPGNPGADDLGECDARTADRAKCRCVDRGEPGRRADVIAGSEPARGVSAFAAAHEH